MLRFFVFVKICYTITLPSFSGLLSNRFFNNFLCFGCIFAQTTTWYI
eukprot:UN31481